jgi:hypothetical protein
VAGLDPQDFFVPGSLIRTDVDAGHPFAAGMQPQVGAAFSQSRAFEVVARYAEEDLLMSGWATGEQRWLASRPAISTPSRGRPRERSP